MNKLNLFIEFATLTALEIEFHALKEYVCFVTNKQRTLNNDYCRQNTTSQ